MGWWGALWLGWWSGAVALQHPVYSLTCLNSDQLSNAVQWAKPSIVQLKFSSLALLCQPLQQKNQSKKDKLLLLSVCPLSWSYSECCWVQCRGAGLTAGCPEALGWKSPPNTCFYFDSVMFVVSCKPIVGWVNWLHFQDPKYRNLCWTVQQSIVASNWNETLKNVPHSHNVTFFLLLIYIEVLC